MFYNDPLIVSSEIWNKILNDKKTTKEDDIKVLKLIFDNPNYEMMASEIADKLNIKHHGVINLQISRFSKRIIDNYKINPPLRDNGEIRYWHIPFLGYEKNGKFPWILRPELVKAMEMLFTSKNDEIYYSDEIIENEDEKIINEGSIKQVYINRYERNKIARDKCLNHFGYKCIICDFDFEKIYGPIGKYKIHVHHKKQLSEIKENYQVDPINDLCPVCPNCHLIIHSKKEAFTVEEMKNIIKTARGII